MAVAIYVYVSLMSFFLFHFSVQTIFVVQFVNCFLLNEKAESLPILLKKRKEKLPGCIVTTDGSCYWTSGDQGDTSGPV